MRSTTPPRYVLHPTVLPLVQHAAAILDMTRMMLEEGGGYTVLMAATPGEALQTAETHAGEIDLLITDVIMPEMNGGGHMAHILVVDDEISMVVLLTVALERQGHTVLSASNGVHALEVLPDEGVHLVVTDINMPQMDGFGLISVLIEKFPGQKILAISGAGGEGLHGDLHAARELGATLCMEKPFELREFYAHVEELLSEWEEELV